MTKKITQLTPEQEALIPVYQEKWRQLTYSTKPIDREQATAAVKYAYKLIGKKEPEIIFSDSPFTALSYIVLGISKEIDSHLAVDQRKVDKTIAKLWYKCIKVRDQSRIFWYSLEREIWGVSSENGRILRKHNAFWRIEIWEQISSKLKIELGDKLENLLTEGIEDEDIFWRSDLNYLGKIILEDLTLKLKQIFSDQINLEIDINVINVAARKMLVGLMYNHNDRDHPHMWNFNSWNSRAAFVDFCVSVLNCPINQTKWSLFQSLVKQCNWMFPLENICFVCDYPRIFSCDNQNRLHGEGSPAIQFADGFSVYAHHGIILPEAYGKIPPNQWHSEWILSEKNAELRRLLIENIGYDRICQELQAVTLDTWQEYALLEIEFYLEEIVEGEPYFYLKEESEGVREYLGFGFESMYLLKMTCPSTGHIHALRVPPNMKSAKEAITWVNWGISPEEFSVQT